MTRSIFILLFVFLPVIGLCQGQPSDSLFQSAQDLELEQKYLEACIIYDTLVHRGYRVDEIQAKRSYRMHRQLEARFLEEVAAGDKAFAASQFIEAREAYYRANGIRPDEAYPKIQIYKIEEILTKQKQ